MLFGSHRSEYSNFAINAMLNGSLFFYFVDDFLRASRWNGWKKITCYFSFQFNELLTIWFYWIRGVLLNLHSFIFYLIIQSVIIFSSFSATGAWFFNHFRLY